MSENSSEHHFALAVTVAVEALKALLLVNGGAATALIALSDKSMGYSKYGTAVLLFALAALLNAVTLVVGYFSQLAYANHRFSREQNDVGGANANFKWHRISQIAAICFVLMSLLASALGMSFAFLAV